MTGPRNITEDYYRWHRLQVQTGDIDPAYPVLFAIAHQLGAGDLGAWLVLHHAAHYHIGSALRSFSQSPGGPFDEELYRLPTGVERRGLRDPRAFHKHWVDLRATVADYGGALQFLTPQETGIAGWNELRARIETVHGNGRWASYKIAELTQKVLGVSIHAPDAGHADSTGPRKGLALLHRVPTGNGAPAIEYLNEITEQLRVRLGEPDVAQVETSLCDFHSLTKGNYYLGRDIDEQAHHLDRVRSDLSLAAIQARELSFPHAYLAEKTGRTGVDKARLKVYAQTGRIVEYP